MDILTLIIGLALLLGGGEAVVRGASALAREVGISPLAIGLTIVAFGTSAPELAVNVIAATEEQQQSTDQLDDVVHHLRAGPAPADGFRAPNPARGNVAGIGGARIHGVSVPEDARHGPTTRPLLEITQHPQALALVVGKLLAHPEAGAELP